MIKVLLVDDSENTRRGLRMRLRLENDIEVVGEAGDAATGMALADSLAPDVVVMDICLPGLDGCEATRKLREKHPTMSVVILTLYGDPGKRKAAADAGACTFREKDGDCQALIDAIRTAGLRARALTETSQVE